MNVADRSGPDADLAAGTHLNTGSTYPFTACPAGGYRSIGSLAVGDKIRLIAQIPEGYNNWREDGSYNYDAVTFWAQNVNMGFLAVLAGAGEFDASQSPWSLRGGYSASPSPGTHTDLLRQGAKLVLELHITATTTAVYTIHRSSGVGFGKAELLHETSCGISGSTWTGADLFFGWPPQDVAMAALQSERSRAIPLIFYGVEREVA